MSMTKQPKGKQEPAQDTDPVDTVASDTQHTILQEGIDYYLENGLMVFTAGFLARRGYCCERGCRHCPYGYLDHQNQQG